MRHLVALGMAITLIMGCAQAPPSPSAIVPTTAHPFATATSQPTSSVRTPDASPAPTAAATLTPRPATAAPSPRPVTAHWEKAGSMRWARHAPIAVLLGDGRVLVLGDEGGKYEAAPDHSRHAELWDPATNRWTRTDSLPKARGDAAAVTLLDGRALIIGGLNDEYASYSSTYLFDPATERWTKTGLLHTARTDPAAAVLHDGRVLVAGGTYFGGYRTGAHGEVDAVLAGYRLADMGPDVDARGLATAELFDPMTGTWSRTGSMRYARWSASAVTLGDGRVLVTSEEAPPEVYEPATGEFTPAAELPPCDAATAGRLGLPMDLLACEPPLATGTALSLPDGDALMLDLESEGVLAGSSVDIWQSYRYRASTAEWVRVGEPVVYRYCEECSVREQEWGPEHAAHVAVVLADGRVLAFGDPSVATRRADLLDPDTGTWSRAPRMPGPRIEAAAVLLADGSALIIGGYRDPSDGYPVGLKDAFRFVSETR